MIRGVLRILVAVSLLVVFACAAPPPPVAAPEAPAPPPAPPAADKVIGTVRVTASALNVRAEASTEGEVIAQVKKGTSLDVLAEADDWTKVKLAGGDVGWVASRFVTSGRSSATTKKKGGCESDFAFIETPTLAFSDRARPGMVVVEASVNTKGVVTKTKVVSNTTGEESLAFLAEREIKGAKFSPPIRNCVPRAFVFTYRRTF
jgi:uncharacterized protein YgiM (DUF1202 family)